MSTILEYEDRSRPQALTEQICLGIAQDIEDCFQRYGMSIAPPSDLSNIIRETRWLAKHIQSTPKVLGERETGRWVKAFIRVQQARNIAFIFNRLSKVQIPQQKLRVLQKRLDQLNQEGNSDAPDIFFELEVAGHIARKYPDWKIDFGEPDIIISYPNGQVGLACKRPKSEQKLSRRLSDAANQGIQSGIPFFIVVDTQELLQPTQSDPDHVLKQPFSKYMVQASSQADLASKCLTFLDDLMVRHTKAIEHACSKGAGGIIFCSRFVGLIDFPVSLCWCWRQRHCPDLDKPGAAIALDLLGRLMEE